MLMLCCLLEKVVFGLYFVEESGPSFMQAVPRSWATDP
jgi:hypothetical protein